MAGTTCLWSVASASTGSSSTLSTSWTAVASHRVQYSPGLYIGMCISMLKALTQQFVLCSRNLSRRSSSKHLRNNLLCDHATSLNALAQSAHATILLRDHATSRNALAQSAYATILLRDHATSCNALGQSAHATILLCDHATSRDALAQSAHATICSLLMQPLATL
jgi:hypothetical protein